ncbi:hypothetical protein [Tepidibacter hydrothermalis]|uniref:Tetratricopeptide repeat protein n=1 Tax=Tepidibacter hydrothermalis TaxID=3036126 RepID=A0ABY8EE46_9FIRM|nr:hypothetical protein [Tepidibacter hydrothermalis]WFD10165.1 hypothetical protein P4S50_17680 [Tepidibacter hydrothermalis]
MVYRDYLVNIVKCFLPYMAEVSTLRNNKKAVILADIDGYGFNEIVAAYKWQGENYIVVLKRVYNGWCIIGNVKGSGYDITELIAARVTNTAKDDIIVGWQVGSIWSELYIYKYTNKGLINISPSEIYYSKIDIEDMKGEGGRVEIAIWIHDTGEAYKVKVLRWCDNGLIEAIDVYPYYFKKVVKYYKEKTKEVPLSPVHLYYLADAQFKSGEYEDALSSINRLLQFEYPYPSKEKAIQLKDEIQKRIY